MKSKVYFIEASLSEGIEVVSQKAVRLFRAGKFGRRFKKNDFTAVKVHVGEKGNTTYIKPGCLKGLIDELLSLKAKPFLTDTSTLYVKSRHNAIDHAMLADEHGFNIETLGIPFIVSDGLFGTSEAAVRIDCPLNKEVSIADNIVRCQSILCLSHFKGHIATCTAATLKNLGMGCSSRKGKMRQHSALKPSVNKKCTLCGQCEKYCPADAITLGNVQAHIDADKCIGCAECVAVCRFDAVEYDWGCANEMLGKSIAEHALGAVKGKEDRCVYFNFILSIATECDCFDTPDLRIIVPDIGIAASADPVAIDKASLDLVEQKGGKSMSELIKRKELDPYPQMEHAQKIGMGTMEYDLVRL
ncbi:MAG: DUF362 domain-containing protein [Sedimentisphaerales bacterium]|nr:DUF362 domain-containing protein [Sedimentisphaerales bacterium]